MNWKTAIKIYMSKTHYLDDSKKERLPYTRKDILIFAFSFFIVIPLSLFLMPIEIYKIKKRGGVPKKLQRYFLYYKK